MLYAFLAFAALTGTCFATMDACTGVVEDDMDRIEYQIPMNHVTLRGNVIPQIEEFLDYLDESLEDFTFLGRFDILKGSSEWYLRRDRTKMYSNGNRRGNQAPKEVSLKYRQCDPRFDNDKHQNDLSFQFQYLDGEECAHVMPTEDYEDIFSEKVESNMDVDTCTQHPMMDGQEWRGIGYTGKLEFDDDDMYGEDCDTAMNVFPPAKWAAWPHDCLASGLADMFDGHCDWFQNPSEWAETLDKDVYNLVLDVDFELTKDKDMDGDLETISEGSLTFQVRFDTWEDWESQDPVARETEMSVKAKKKDTDDGYWEESVSTLNEIVNQIAGCGNPWIRYSGCRFNDVKLDECATKRPTMAPTHSPNWVEPPPLDCCTAKDSGKRRWVNKCSAEMTEDDCGKSRKFRRQCQWSACMDP